MKTYRIAVIPDDDGRLPQYSLGGSVVPFIQIPGAPATEAPRR